MQPCPTDLNITVEKNQNAVSTNMKHNIIYFHFKHPQSGQFNSHGKMYGHMFWYGRYSLYLLKSIDRLLIFSGNFQGKRK